jgi:integrase
MVCLSHIYSYGVKRGIVAKNPLEAMDKPKVKSETEPETITTGEAEQILQYACRDTSCQDLLPGVVLALFCGIRPAELARLRYKDLFPGGRHEVYLSRTITKTNRDRIAKIRPNVIAWLEYSKTTGRQCAPDDFILPGENEKQRGEKYTRTLKRLADGAGVRIPKDAFRHTAATMICALDGMAEAAEELGNDIKTLQKHYRHAVHREESESFYRILPPVKD